MTTTNLPDVARQLCELLGPLEAEERQRVWTAAMALLGQPAGPSTSAPLLSSDFESAFGPNAKRWLVQNRIDEASLHELFFVNGGQVELIAQDVPGTSKRLRTQNCYLLCGIRALLGSDEPSFADAEAVELCKQVGCYDSPNHSSARKDLGNKMRGAKEAGFVLSIPGLRAAADLVKGMI